jgi:hypothetical protein
MIPGTYSTAPVISGARLTIDGAGSSLNIAVADGGIEVENGANLTLTGLQITSGNGEGIRCEGGTGNVLSVSHVTIDAKGFAILGNPCTVTAESSSFRTRNSNLAVVLASPPVTMTMSRCTFQGGDGVQALGGGSFVRVDNSLFLDQLGVDGAANGIQLGGSGFGTVVISFSTFVNSQLRCSDGIPACAGGAAAGACIDDSIIVGSAGDTVTGTACSVNYSIATPQSAALSGGHNLVNMDPGFINSQSDYALKNTSPAVDAADPTATAPSPDLAGVSRPQGARADLGAYEYKP